jgi:hypothetical protein
VAFHQKQILRLILSTLKPHWAYRTPENIYYGRQNSQERFAQTSRRQYSWPGLTFEGFMPGKIEPGKPAEHFPHLKRDSSATWDRLIS